MVGRIGKSNAQACMNQETTLKCVGKMKAHALVLRFRQHNSLLSQETSVCVSKLLPISRQIFVLNEPGVELKISLAPFRLRDI